jgi:hypothetical protein
VGLLRHSLAVKSVFTMGATDTTTTDTTTSATANTADDKAIPESTPESEAGVKPQADATASPDGTTASPVEPAITASPAEPALIAQHREPTWTNHVETFRDTLDYIWASHAAPVVVFTAARDNRLGQRIRHLLEDAARAGAGAGAGREYWESLRARRGSSRAVVALLQQHEATPDASASTSTITSPEISSNCDTTADPISDDAGVDVSGLSPLAEAVFGWAGKRVPLLTHCAPSDHAPVLALLRMGGEGEGKGGHC